MIKYKYIGDGAGVPGLPHEISEEEIEQFNPDQLSEWQGVLDTGLYIEINVETDQAPSEGE